MNFFITTQGFRCFEWRSSLVHQENTVGVEDGLVRNTHNCGTIESTVDVCAHGRTIRQLHEPWEGSNDRTGISSSDHGADHTTSRVSEDSGFSNSKAVLDLIFIRVRYALIARSGLLQVSLESRLYHFPCRILSMISWSS